MRVGKGLAVVLAAVLALGLAACSAAGSGPADGETEKAVASELATLEAPGFDVKDLELKKIVQTESKQDGDKLETSGGFEASNASVEIEGTYSAEWSRDGSTWKADSCLLEVSSMKALVAPGESSVQELIRADFDAVAEGFGIGKDLIESKAYTADSLTVKGVTFDESDQTATAVVDVKGASALATDGQGTVALRVTSEGWAVDTASSESSFTTSIVGTWDGTIVSRKESYVLVSEGDAEAKENVSTDGASAKLVIDSYDSATGAVKGNVAYVLDKHSVEQGGQYVTSDETASMGTSYDFEGVCETVDGKLELSADASYGKYWIQKFTVVFSGDGVTDPVLTVRDGDSRAGLVDDATFTLTRA